MVDLLRKLSVITILIKKKKKLTMFEIANMSQLLNVLENEL